jgi:hypothetical protein
MGVLLKPISDRLLWIEAALFLRQDERDDRLRWFVPELLLQIKNARLDRSWARRRVRCDMSPDCL